MSNTAAAVSGLQARKQTLAIVIAASLLGAHPFKLGLGFGGFLVLALHFDNQRLLLGEPPFAFDDIALHLPQLVVDRSRVHHGPRADVLRRHVGEWLPRPRGLGRAARRGLVRSRGTSPSTQLVS